MNVTMEGRYQPTEFEDKTYEKWMKADAFKATVNKEKEPYTIVLPPPNITGQLHMGHALDHTLQDILIRYKRLMGFEALWLPGTDHASIATEVKVWDKLREDGVDIHSVTREGFLEHAWQWKETYGDRIVEQMKKLGNSCDWSKERFTMDENCSHAVQDVFVKLYEKGYIYRGYRLINWCPDCGTSLSDAEVEHEDKQGNFYHIKYFVKDSDEFLEIATTRPETLVGDSGVAVHPEDKRYAHLIGKTVIVPIIGREIPVIADSYVDIETGTGALKVTPAHDPNDFELGNRHGLEQIIIMDNDAKMNSEAGPYAGMDRYECRKQIVKDLEANDLLVDVKPHQHNVGTCYRCHTVVEPMLSHQWFVKMEEMAKPALEALHSDLEFVPERFSKIYVHWLENIRDWCISRQLWWGHRIPAYYCDACGHIEVSKEMPDTCSICGSSNLRQDEDVLDTWFSSALWPFSTLGWPNDTEEFNYFYPTDVLVTGYDIIFFWVVRMVFSGYEQTGVSPFKDVYIHGLVRDANGKKMSKSLGNGVDPLEVIAEFGADALRFMLTTGNSPGNDQRYQTERVEAARNFANKLWNASRFVLMGVDSFDDTLPEKDAMTLADKWIISRVNETIKDVEHNMDKYDLGMAGDKIYEFVWNEYCDWFIEMAKPRLYGEDKKAKETVERVLIYVLKRILVMLHPFMPFITEEIWSNISEELLITSKWYVADGSLIDEDAIEDMAIIMDAIKSIRNARAQLNIPPSKKSRLFVKTATKSEIFASQSAYFSGLASVSDIIVIADNSELPEDTISAVSHQAELFMPADDLIDYTKENERLLKEQAKLQSEIDRIVKKLSNQGFLAKAPEELVAKEREKQGQFEDMLRAVNESLEKVAGKLG
ncbi:MULTISPECIES: valine--tRNA ligase [unclassified Fusibacter]|uniref:valine--tRNA ligase n=1 Tax=unclassified Fusibacter TaxID=2624464 RepID=UPI0010104838|nr:MULTISPECIES: valine--tRNA ligase [unclassified Fusibacter]MCK8058313.1 valine--tRNA ligase [Fusibacter sp. A2]NPE20896.1 valine--tRNA ligase [Fusibacter sp. A1]RXV63100.1 valine--tRNA ligase [Fusibacter sp. A1]